MIAPPEHQPEANVEVRSSGEGFYVKARIAGAPDLFPRQFVGVFESREEALSEAAGWALGWLRGLRRIG